MSKYLILILPAVFSLEASEDYYWHYSNTRLLRESGRVSFLQKYKNIDTGMGTYYGDDTSGFFNEFGEWVEKPEKPKTLVNQADINSTNTTTPDLLKNKCS